jgi:hypothetical protein
MTGYKYHGFSMSDYLLAVVLSLDVQQRAVQGAINISRKTVINIDDYAVVS